ncbi:MAG: iron-sulfur cluster assembly protein, partial [Pseudomonadota bacterium]|nr:iron-sulfur cluster assembly protein [Pseudomonadota bacterium]
MSPIDEKTIIEALSGLKHPQTGQDIVSGDIVQGITIRDGNVGFLLAIHPDIAEAFESVRLACEERVRAIPGILSATVVLTAHQVAPSISPFSS